MYSYVVTSQKPTAIYHAVTCNFTGPTDTNLILGKGTLLDIRTWRNETLSVELEVSIYGKISSIVPYRIHGSNVDVILVLTEHKHFCVLGFDVATRKLVTKYTGNCRDPVGRELDCGIRAIGDPDHRFLCMMVYEGLLKLVQIDGSVLKEPFNVRTEVQSVVDIAFLHGCVKPTLCMLYEGVAKSTSGSGAVGRYLKTFMVNARERELEAMQWTKSSVPQGAHMLIPIPKPSCGVVVIGDSIITYLNGTTDTQSVIFQAERVCCYSVIEKEVGTRILLGCADGKMYVLLLLKDPTGRVIGLAVDFVGGTTIPRSISCIDRGVVFVGSVFADSKLIKMNPPSVVDAPFEILETMINVGPIVDMCVIDSDKQGSAGSSVVVTCSGAFNGGSLRFHNSGIGINEQASIELPGINGMWSLRPSEKSTFDKFLVQSFTGATKILGIENEEMNEVEIAGFEADASTLFCGNMKNGLLLQVTTQAAILVNEATLTVLHTYAAPARITVASANQEQVVLALTGGCLVYLSVDSVAGQFVVEKSMVLDQEIACISLRPIAMDHASSVAVAMDCDDNHSDAHSLYPSGRSQVVAVGMWTDGSVRLLALPSFELIEKVVIGLDTQARDLLLVTLENVTHLFVGLGDGTLVSFIVDYSSGVPSLQGKKRSLLGTCPLSFSCFLNNNGALCVFVACDRPIIIYTHRSKIHFSAVNQGNINKMVPFHTEMFPGCLAMATPDGLTIGAVDGIQKIHVKSFPLMASPRRLAHHQSQSVLAVCLEQEIYTSQKVAIHSSVEFFDLSTMEKLFSFPCGQYETCTSCISCKLGNEDADISSGMMMSEADLTEYVIVGTATSRPGDAEPRSGRILVFEILPQDGVSAAIEPNSSSASASSSIQFAGGKIVRLVTEKLLKNAAFSLVGLHGKLAVGVGSKVHLFNWLKAPTDATVSSSKAGYPQLQLECSNSGNVLSILLKSRGDFILVGDLIRSFTLLQNRDAKLVELARDFSCHALRAIEIVGDANDVFLGADDCGNLLTVRRNIDAVTDEDRGKLMSSGEFHLGDYINSLRFGMLNGQPVGADAGASASSASSNAFSSAAVADGAPTRPSTALLFGTVSGAIGTIFSITEEDYQFFSCLERLMRTMVPSIGALSHFDFRSFNNERLTKPPKNFIDGDLVERILDLPAADVETIVRTLNEELTAIAQGQSVTGKRSLDGTAPQTSYSIFNAAAPISLSVEECLRKVEELARLH